MPVRLEDNVVYLVDECSIEEAESLYETLMKIDRPRFDLSEAKHVHCSIVQLIMACSGVVRGIGTDPVLAACFRGRITS